MTRDANITQSNVLMITATDLHKSYDGVEAVNAVSLEVGSGDTLGLIGPNGAGKTTLLRLLATLAKPDTGRITIGGIDALADPGAIRRRLGFMPAEFGLPKNLNLWEYLRYFACLAGLCRGEREGAIDQALELTDLRGRDRVMINGLSTGNKQRLLLAKTLLHDPSLLILDEPASGLDPRARVEVREILQTLASLGKTIAISSHILKDLESICSHVLIMEAGQVAALGDVADLKRRLSHASADHRLRVKVDPEKVEAAQACPAGLESVTEVVAGREGWLELAGHPVSPNVLLAALIDAGIEIRGFEEHHSADLEAVFIRSTKGAVT